MSWWFQFDQPSQSGSLETAIYNLQLHTRRQLPTMFNVNSAVERLARVQKPRGKNIRLVCCMCSSFRTISHAIHMQRYGRVSHGLVPASAVHILKKNCKAIQRHFVSCRSSRIARSYETCLCGVEGKAARVKASGFLMTRLPLTTGRKMALDRPNKIMQNLST